MTFATQEADIYYSPLRTSPPVLAEVATSSGFPAMVVDIHEAEALMADQRVQVMVSVEGMTCMSCVRNIEGTISTRPGVKSISVSLEKKLANLVIDPLEISPESVAEAIDDMGFPAKLLSPLPSSAPSHIETRIRVEGMTCQSCVRNIEGNMSTKPGIINIKVSLPDKQAVVTYDPKVVTPTSIAEQIEDMGFEASVEETFSENPGFRHGSMSSGSHGDASQQTVVSIAGMTCHSCVKTIEDKLGQNTAIKSIKVSLAEQKGTVEYFPKQITPEKLCQLIDDMGFQASLPGSASKLPCSFIFLCLILVFLFKV